MVNTYQGPTGTNQLSGIQMHIEECISCWVLQLLLAIQINCQRTIIFNLRQINIVTKAKTPQKSSELRAFGNNLKYCSLYLLFCTAIIPKVPTVTEVTLANQIQGYSSITPSFQTTPGMSKQSQLASNLVCNKKYYKNMS